MGLINYKSALVKVMVRFTKLMIVVCDWHDPTETSF